MELADDLARLAAGREQPRALLGRAEDDGAAAEDSRRHGAVQRARIRGQRHPRGHVRRHQPVLRDRDEQQVEEEPLLLGRLAAREEQVEVLGEAQPAHQVAGQVAAAHLDAVGVGLRDAADRLSRHVRLRQIRLRASARLSPAQLAFDVVEPLALSLQ